VGHQSLLKICVKKLGKYGR